MRPQPEELRTWQALEPKPEFSLLLDSQQSPNLHARGCSWAACMFAQHTNSNSAFGQLFCDSIVHFLEQVTRQTWGISTRCWHPPKGAATAAQVSLHAPGLPCCLSSPALRQRILQPWEIPRSAEAALRLLQVTAVPETQGLATSWPRASRVTPARRMGCTASHLVFGRRKRHTSSCCTTRSASSAISCNPWTPSKPPHGEGSNCTV